MLSHTANEKKLNIGWEIRRLTIEPQTFCYLKEIKLKVMKIQQKTQQWVTITQFRFTDKNRLLTKNSTNNYVVTPTR